MRDFGTVMRCHVTPLLRSALGLQTAPRHSSRVGFGWANGLPDQMAPRWQQPQAARGFLALSQLQVKSWQSCRDETHG